MPSRLALAAAAIVPVAHFWWVAIEGHTSGGWLGSFYWFHDVGIQSVMAALAGVAIASGFRRRTSTPAARR